MNATNANSAIGTEKDDVIRVTPGERIKLMLRRNNLTQNWLEDQLSQRGIETDKSSLSRVLTGQRCGPKSSQIISESLLILDRYEKVFGVVS